MPSTSIRQRAASKPSNGSATAKSVPVQGSRGQAVPPTARPLLLSYVELPAWMQDNPLIRGAYRPPTPSISGCLWSIVGYMHNETVNIHSHIWGAALFVFLLASVYTTTLSPYPSLRWQDIAGFAVFLASAVTCLSLSFLYHTFSCHSHEFANTWHTLDYAGICILICGSFIPCLYYGFYCDAATQIFYITSIMLAGSLALYIVLHPSYRTSAYRWSRTSVFLALGLSAVVPIVHALHTSGAEHVATTMGLTWLVSSGALYIFGAVLYAARIPERFAPGWFDIWGASHQIFHLCVVFAGYCHFRALLKSFTYFHGDPTAVHCPVILPQTFHRT